MVKKGMGYFTGLVALYLGVYYASGAGQLITAGSSGAVDFTKALQGR